MIENKMSLEDFKSLNAGKKSRQKAKYHAEKTTIDGHRFDSLKEAARYQELKLLEKAGEIHSLELQKTFELLPTQRDKNGKLLERKCTYKADFCYYKKDGKYVVEDVKGMRTESYKIKKKLMLYINGIRINEI